MRILLVEDDKELARRLGDVLRESGFIVDHAADGETGCLMAETQTYSAAILDLGLPVLPGLDVLRRWRADKRNFPVLILSARGTWSERVEGLNAGADDYVAKPFQAAEVVARLRALIRRASGIATPVLKHGDLIVDPASGDVTLAGKPVELTALELRILTHLLHRAGRIVSQGELSDNVYELENVRDSNTIEVYIARLRKKLGRDLIRTVRGLGYRVA